MSYPDDGDPKILRILEQLRSNMEAIATPTHFTDVDRAFVYEGRQITAGTQAVVIVIVPTFDSVSGFASCNVVDRSATIQVVGAIRRMAGSEKWKSDGRKLAADIVKTLADDMQLGGEVVYIEPTSEELFDAGSDTIAICQVTCRLVYQHVFDNPSLPLVP